jgi:putative nucleotidyltransferase with HDIG domain
MGKTLQLVPSIDRDGPSLPVPEDTSGPPPSSGPPSSGAATSLERYLPLAILTTAAVVVLPVALVALVVRAEDPLPMLGATALAMALSVPLTSAGAAVWKRLPGSRDLVFADLMLWGWARRYWTERRIGRARMLYESARRAGPSVSIELIERLSSSLQARDASTQGHSQRVARHAGQIARALRLSAEQRAKVRTAAAVHDVGKLYTPRAILNNPGFLSEDEYRVLKRHPVDGADMLAGVGDPEIADMVRHHHERLDGSGYPDGLSGEEIPLGARIIAVADTFDAISSDRAYRSARTHKKALDILTGEAGALLDGAVVAAFVQTYTARRPVARLAFVSAGAQRALAKLAASSTAAGLGGAGIAPLVPAVGVAGLLALAHGPHAGALAGAGRPSHAGGGQANVLASFPVAARRGAPAPEKGTRRTRHGTLPRPHETSAAPIPGAPAPASPPTSSATAPATPAPATSAVPPETPAPQGAPPSGAGSPPAPPPPAGAPSSSQAPAVPTAPPIVPASTPAVSLPSREVSVSTPVVTVSTTTPTLTLPAVSLP